MMTPACETPVRVPVAALSETRATFPGFVIVHEIDFHTDQPWQGLGYVAAACARAGLTLRALRCTAEGRIFCKVVDRAARIQAFADGLADTDLVALRGWVTVVTFERWAQG